MRFCVGSIKNKTDINLSKNSQEKEIRIVSMKPVDLEIKVTFSI